MEHFLEGSAPLSFLAHPAHFFRSCQLFVYNFFKKNSKQLSLSPPYIHSVAKSTNPHHLLLWWQASSFKEMFHLENAKPDGVLLSIKYTIKAMLNKQINSHVAKECLTT